MIRILIVDDEETGRTVMEEMFGKYGKSVSVSTGNDAVTLFEKALERGKGFDLVLLDISMDDISGLAVLKTIKEIEADRNVAEDQRAKVLMVTAHSEKDIVVDSIKLGCRAYFIKPLKQDVVDKKMSELGFKPAG